MKQVNALTIRNRLGEVLAALKRDGEPVLISKGRKVEAVLITPEQFERRFLDYQAEERKRQLMERILELREKRTGSRSSVSVLRELRGYGA